MPHRPRVHAPAPSRTGLDAPAARALRAARHDPGAPLATETRHRMEAGFGHSFADIRVHDGPAASSAAAGVEARAFTVGQDLVFGAGAFAPATATGERLLAHELAHAVQNARAAPGTDLPLVSAGHEAGEAEARGAAAQFAAGETAGVESAPAAVIARSPEGSEDDGPGFFGTMSKYLGLGESFAESIAEQQWAKNVPNVGKLVPSARAVPVLGTYSDVFGVYSGMSGIYGGVNKMANGDPWGAADTAKGALDTVSSYGGLAGSGPVEGYAGMGSGAIDVGRGLYTAIASDDLDTATKGAYRAANGYADIITGVGDASGILPVKAAGRALGWGLDRGAEFVSWTDAGAKERGDYGQNDQGVNRTGSEAAADSGREFNDDIRGVMPGWMPDLATDVIAGVGGGVATVGASWWNAGKGAYNNLMDGPSYREEVEDMMQMYAGRAQMDASMEDMMRQSDAADVARTLAGPTRSVAYEEMPPLPTKR